MSGVALALNRVDKIYQRRGKPPVHAVKDLCMDIDRGRDRRVARLVRVREDLDLAHDCGL